MEVGCPGTWGLELPTPNPGSKSTPAWPTCNPDTSPAHHTQPQPKHLSHTARSSVEVIITIINNNSNNNDNNDNNNNNNNNNNNSNDNDKLKVIMIQEEKGGRKY